MERCAEEARHLGQVRARLDMSLAIRPLPPPYPACRLGRVHPVGRLSYYGEPTAITSLPKTAEHQLVHWSFAHRLHPHDPPPPPSNNPQAGAMQLLDGVLGSHRRPDTMRHGVSDLISCAMERLVGSTGEPDGQGLLGEQGIDGDGEWTGIAQESADLLSPLLTKGSGWSGPASRDGSSLEGSSGELSQAIVPT